MPNRTFNTSIYQLDDETLYLLRISAITLISEYAPRKIYSEGELKDYLASIPESKKYFTRLKECIGTTDGNVKRRPIKINKVWDAVCTTLNHRLSAGRVAKSMQALEKLIDVLGFPSVEQLKNAALSKGYRFVGQGTVSVEDQDAIAKAFGYDDWLDMNGIENVKYLTSETALQSAYGKYRSGSALSLPTLNVISQFICDKNWNEYDCPKVRQQVKEELLHKVIKTPKTNATDYLNSLGMLHEGDEITIRHNDGSESKFIFAGNQLKSTFNLCA